MAVEVPFWTSSRFGIILFLFFGNINNYALRNNINMAIVCMVNKTGLQTDIAVDNSSTRVITDCEAATQNETTAFLMDGELLLDRAMVGQVLGIVFWPYAIFQIPSGVLVTKIGPRIFLGCSMMLSAVVTVLIPLLSSFSYMYILMLRVLLGFFASACPPSSVFTVGSWAHPTERARFTQSIFAGEQLGLIIIYVGTGLLCRYGFAGGWPSSFYLCGIYSFILSVLWIAFLRDSPWKSERISKAEKKYLTDDRSCEESQKRDAIPWRGIFKSKPVYAVIVGHCTSTWTVFFMTTYMPTYLDDVFHFDIENNGILSALPSVPYCIIALSSGWISDYICSRYLSRNNTRRLFNTAATVIPVLLLIAVGYVDCSSPILAVVLVTSAFGLKGFRAAGCITTGVDIAPRYAGLIYGCANTLAALGGYLSSVMVLQITKNSLREEWQICFYITAAVELFGAIFFNILMSSDVQPWANGTDGDKGRYVETVETDEIIERQNTVDPYYSNPSYDSTYM